MSRRRRRRICSRGPERSIRNRLKQTVLTADGFTDSIAAYSMQFDYDGELDRTSGSAEDVS